MRDCWIVVALSLVSACGDSIGSDELVDTMPEPPGANCPTGGYVLETGHDTNGNGVLDPNEIQHTSYLCNPAPLNQLVAIVPEPPGANCANGGQAIEIGLDTNGNGMLDPNEIQQRSYVCQPSAAPQQLVGIVPVAPGASCTYGGDAIEVGLDTNGDGILEQSEVQTTTYLCASQAQPLPQFIDGDVIVHSSIDLAQLSQLVTLTGDLEIDGATMTQPIELPALKHAGSVHVNANTLVSFPMLIDTTTFGLTGSCTQLSLPSLTAATVRIATPVANPTLPALASGAFYATTTNGPVGDVSLPAFTTGDVFVGGTNNDFPPVTSLSLPAFTSGTLRVWAAVTSLDAPLFQGSSTANILTSFYLTQLTSLSLPALALGGLQLDSNQVMTGASVPKLASGDVWIQSMPALATIDLSSLQTSKLYVHTNAALSNLSLPSLTTATTIDIQSNAALSSIDLAVLQSATNIQIGLNQALSSVSAPKLTSLVTFDVWGSPSLPTCKLAAIATQSGATNVAIYMEGNDDTAMCP